MKERRNNYKEIEHLEINGINRGKCVHTCYDRLQIVGIQEIACP